MEQQQPSGHRPEKASAGAAPSWSGVMFLCRYCEVEVDERSARRSVYAHRGAQAVLNLKPSFDPGGDGPRIVPSRVVAIGHQQLLAAGAARLHAAG